MPQPDKKPRKRKTTTPPADSADDHIKALTRLVRGLVDWHLSKINGDPQEANFDLLLHENGPGGGSMAKFCLGDHEESKEQLKAQLEGRSESVDMYAFSFKGGWTDSAGVRHDGAVVTFESRKLTPRLYGFEIKPNAEGRLEVTSPPIALGPATWSLLHRSK